MDDNEGRLALRWYTANSTTIGFVLVQGHDVEDWFKVYIGVGLGLNEDQDTERIANSGSPLVDEALARVLAGDRVMNRVYRY